MGTGREEQHHNMGIKQLINKAEDKTGSMKTTVVCIQSLNKRLYNYKILEAGFCYSLQIKRRKMR
jgi:hypothetical protein